MKSLCLAFTSFRRYILPVFIYSWLKKLSTPYRMSCDFDEASRTVRFREAATESSRSIPPPTLTVEKTTQRGTHVSKSRTDRSVAGGGHLNYGALREAFEQVVQAGGRQFTVEVGKTP